MNVAYLRRNAKNAWVKILHRGGISNTCLKSRSHRGALILAYHRINMKEYIINNTLMPGMYTCVESFTFQIRWLVEHFKIVTLSEIIKRIRNGSGWSDPLCAITFDDGWYDNYEYAFPIMRKYNLPWTIFVNEKGIGVSEPNCFDMCFEIVVNISDVPMRLTGIEDVDSRMSVKLQDRIEKARLAVNAIRKIQAHEFDRVNKRLKEFYLEKLDSVEMNTKYRKLSWDDIREMQQFGTDFGYHGRSHYMLTQLPPERLEDEVVPPREIAKLYGVNIENIFSYPDGKYRYDIIELLKKSGYEGATSLIPGFNYIRTDPYELKRINIHEGCASALSNFLFNIAFS